MKIKLIIIILGLMLLTSFVTSQIITPSKAIDDIKDETEYTQVLKQLCEKEYYTKDGIHVCEGDTWVNVTEYPNKGTLTPEDEIKLLRQALYELNKRVEVLEKR